MPGGFAEVDQSPAKYMVLGLFGFKAEINFHSSITDAVNAKLEMELKGGNNVVCYRVEPLP